MPKNTVGKSLTMILQVGITMMTPIALCVAFAVWIDSFWENGWLLPLMLFLGVAAGFRNVWLMVKSYTRQDGSEESKTNEHVRELKRIGKERKKLRDLQKKDTH